MLSITDFDSMLQHVKEQKEIPFKQQQERVQMLMEDENEAEMQVIVNRLEVSKGFKERVDNIVNALLRQLKGADAVNCMQASLSAVNIVKLNEDSKLKKCCFSGTTDNVHRIQFVLSVKDIEEEVHLSAVFNVSDHWIDALKAIIGLNKREDWLLLYIDKPETEKQAVVEMLNDAAKYLKLMTQTLK